jgi:hypothetical protein
MGTQPFRVAGLGYRRRLTRTIGSNRAERGTRYSAMGSESSTTRPPSSGSGSPETGSERWHRLSSEGGVKLAIRQVRFKSRREIRL